MMSSSEDDACTAPTIGGSDSFGSDPEKGGLRKRGTKQTPSSVMKGAVGTPPEAARASSRAAVANSPEIEELRVLLPALRRVRSILKERDGSATGLSGGATQATADEERERDDDPQTEATISNIKIVHRSYGGSVLQHISRGLGAARASLSSSSSSEDFGAQWNGSDRSAPRQEYVRLAHDVYSLVYFCPPRSVAFLFGICTFLFQIFTLSLILVDIVVLESYNPINIPAGVSVAVRMAQFVAILIAVATQDDLITAINEFHVGFNRGDLTGEGPHEAGGAKWQWALSVSTRLAQGGLCLAVTFILIMQGREVVELFLDFLAVTFVSTLDDIMFTLAREGYFSQRIKTETDMVCRIRVPKKEIGSHLFRPMVFLTVSAAMLIGWGVVMSEQMAGHFLSCTSFAVQFGDEGDITLGYFSKRYNLNSFDKAKRPIYIEENLALGDGLEGKGMFAYCADLGSWTFSYPDTLSDVADPCHWYAKSVETDVFDMLTLNPSDWFVLSRRAKKPVPFQHLDFHCVDCHLQVDSRGPCGSIGVCVDNHCICNSGRIGMSCEFEEPCPSIEVNAEFGGFPGPKSWADHYSIFYHCNSTDAVEVYGRPAFISDQEAISSLQVLLFTGRRWVAADAQDLIYSVGTRRVITKCELAHVLKAQFHAYWAYNFTPGFVSSPSDAGTPSDSAVPLGLSWYRSNKYNAVSYSLNVPIPTELICSVCTIESDRNPCNNGGVCKPDRTCDCPSGTFGSLCHIQSFALCNNLAVHMGEGDGLALGGLSGFYTLAKSGIRINGRAVYVEGRSQGAVFAFCDDEKAWTLTVIGSYPISNDSVSMSNFIHTDFDPCTDWTAISPSTDSYDIASVATNWLARKDRSSSNGIPLDYFLLRCNDCSRKKTQCSGAGKCNNDGICICDKGAYGPTCAVKETCNELVVDRSSERIQEILPSTYKQLYHDSGDEVLVHTRPVYYAELHFLDDRGIPTKKDYGVLVYSGHRWLAIESRTIPALRNGTTSEELANFFSNDFHAYFSTYDVRFVSEPAIRVSVVHFASPVKLKWYETAPFSRVPANVDAPIKAMLHCAFCDDINYPCYNGGSCINRTCNCPLGAYGSHCQIFPLCKSLSVQFNLPIPNEIQRFSGIYDLTTAQTEYSERPIYSLNGDSNAMLAYCFVRAQWTFTFWEDNRTLADINPCTQVFAKSSLTNSFNVLSSLSWFVQLDGNDFSAVMPTAMGYVCNDESFVSDPGSSFWQPHDQRLANDADGSTH